MHSYWDNMQTLRKKTSPLKYRNEPARFFGDGVVFKAKLIGILEVGEARGDRMCQEALQDLKVAIRAAGEHKQRISIHVTIEGLRLRDEKTGDSLYHHPVHKISFIAQDMTDSRAFGYIFGSPDSGHRFFGIKTDKSASQVVLAMRDLFQVVFELKKKEIELARQHIQNKITLHEHQQVAQAVKNSVMDTSSRPSESSRAAAKAEKSPESVADLVDLEQELSSIQRGITQMERITPSEGPPKSVLDEDPFGDSFAIFSTTPFNILPPPESSRRHPKPNSRMEDPLAEISTKSSTPPIGRPAPAEDWLQSPPRTSYFEDQRKRSPDDSFSALESSLEMQEPKSNLMSAFTDLDPLGTGTTRPYVDKKFFFQDLKNPPKKVLRDLSGHDLSFDANFAGGSILDEQVKPEKEVDPFEEDDFANIPMDPFGIAPKSIILPDTKIPSHEDEKSRLEERRSNDSGSGSSGVFNGPLQVSLPPESWHSYGQKRLERQNSDGSSGSTSRNRPSAFKQNTVDVLNSFSTKKMPKPTLFGQKFTRRDSNGINMRRLQESDSLSETETAPEPPPRPDIHGQHNPPPLPPKKQFSDIIIRPSARSYSSAAPKDSSLRYEYASKIRSQENAPPLPLPSRKVGRTDANFPGPGRPGRKPGEEDDYLTPINDIPTILPPPQKKDPSKSRAARKSDTDPKNLDAPTPPYATRPHVEMEAATSLPDITLSQLLTLDINDLSVKLGVPVAKLNTMTLMELTNYLGEFVEKSKRSHYEPPTETPNDSPVFKVSFDEGNDQTFVAKFDDNFGEDDHSFVANFDNFNSNSSSTHAKSTTPAPSADRYAVFREIMDQELQQDSFEETASNSNSLDASLDFQKEVDQELNRFSPKPTFETNFKSSPLTIATKFDSKITDMVANAKDRYAALRDIILVEDLFDKPMKPPLAQSESYQSDEMPEDPPIDDFKVAEYENVVPFVPETELPDSSSPGNGSSPTINIKDTEEEIEPTPIEEEQTAFDQFDEPKLSSNQFLSTSVKDDLEIDEYMQKAISNLSLDSRDHLSPSVGKSPGFKESINASTSPRKTPAKSPMQELLETPTMMLNDIATSPIPTAKSPSLQVDPPESERRLSASRSPVNLRQKSPTPLSVPIDINREKTITPNKELQAVPAESWAVFDQPEADNKKETTPTNVKPTLPLPRDGQESPYSSDGKNEWKQKEVAGGRRWKGHTSSSSRDVSPWDEEGPDYRRRYHHAPPHSSDRYARPPGPKHHSRRKNSCDEDYDDDMMDRRAPRSSRIAKPPINRSKEILDTWSPPEDEDERLERSRSSFERQAYERSTYGPPTVVREPKSLPYDRRDYKSRRYYRHDYDPPHYMENQYDVPPPRAAKSRKEYEEYEGGFERGTRESRSARDYFYGREKSSFDRDSNDSYDSERMGRRSMGSGEIYGSIEGREREYHRGERDRYLAQTRSLRRGQRGEEQDSDGDLRRPPGDSSSLHRSAVQRPKPLPVQLDDEVWGSSGKSWKRPSSATESDRRYASGDSRRPTNPPSGSDGEKDKRFRKKTRGKGKEIELRSNYATIRYSQRGGREYYDFEDDQGEYGNDPGTTSPRLHESESSTYYRRPTNYYKNTTPRSESRSFSESIKPPGPYYGNVSGQGGQGFEDEEEEYAPTSRQFKKSSSRDLYFDDTKERFGKFGSGNFEEAEQVSSTKNQKPVRKEYDSPTNNPAPAGQKFNFDDGNGFESDFNSPPKPNQQLTAPQQKPFRFSNDFSDKESPRRPPQQQKAAEQNFASFDAEFPAPNSNNGSTTSSTGQKLRFNENVSVSKFDSNASAQQMFEDDFSKSDISFEMEDQWTPDLPSAGGTAIPSSMKKVGSSLKSSAAFRQENIKKSESVNIFAKKVDDPFEDDDFFVSGAPAGKNGNRRNGGKNGVASAQDFQWKNNFANFDDNI